MPQVLPTPQTTPKTAHKPLSNKLVLSSFIIIFFLVIITFTTISIIRARASLSSPSDTSKPDYSEILSAFETGNHELFYTDYDALYLLRTYSETHPDDSAIKSFLETYDKNASIADILPLYSNDPANPYYIFFETPSSADCTRLFCLTIGADTDTAYSAALTAIHDNGFDPSTFELLQLHSTPHN